MKSSILHVWQGSEYAYGEDCLLNGNNWIGEDQGNRAEKRNDNKSIKI